MKKMEFPKERIPRVLDLETNPLVKTAKAIGVFFGR